MNGTPPKDDIPIDITEVLEIDPPLDENLFLLPHVVEEFELTNAEYESREEQKKEHLLEGEPAPENGLGSFQDG